MGNLTFCFFIFIFFFSCKSEPRIDVIGEQFGQNKTPTVKLKKVDSVDAVGENLFFNHVLDFKRLKQHIYIANSASNQIVAVDKNFNLLKKIGQPGDGPGEFSNLKYIHSTRDQIYAYGTSNRGIANFSYDGQLQGSVKTPEGEIVETHFLVHKDEIYISSPRSSKMITSFSSGGEVRKVFGAPYPHLTEKQVWSRNRGHLIPKDETSFWFIGHTEPIIQIYSYTGQLKETYELRNIPIIKQFIQGANLRRKRENNPQNTSYLLFNDAEYHNQKLFLLMYTYDRKGKAAINKVLVLNYEKGSLTPSQILDLSEKSKKNWYLSFCIYDKQLIAFDQLSSAFYFFELPEL